MLWSDAACYGTAGGLITEVADLFVRVRTWQEVRRSLREQGEPPPGISKYVDLVPDLLVIAMRALLGCAAGWLLHDQISGIYAAGAVGASAPAIFAVLGRPRVIPEALGVRLDVPSVVPPEAVLAQSLDGQRKSAE